MAIEIFSRREQKYLITIKQYEQLVEKFIPYMRFDKFGINGMYTVTSLYFDNDEHAIYYETKNKVKYRQKLRLRVYNQADLTSTAFFEIKQKHDDVVNKRRLLMPLKEAYRYLKHGSRDNITDFDGSNHQVLKEIDYFRDFYHLQPEMIISYRRQAFHGIDNSDLRITFDLDLKCRKADLSIENGPYGDHFIDPNLVVLEVKVTDSVPLWLARFLQELDCEQRSASKFCTSVEYLSKEVISIDEYMEQPTLGGYENGTNQSII